MKTQFSAYNYTPLLNIKKSDFIDLNTTAEEFIPFGEDNLLPTQLNKLAREIPVHRAILNSKTNYVLGKGLSSKNPIISDFIAHPNNSQITLSTILKRLIFDYFTHGNAWIEVVSDKNLSFLYFYHIDTSKVRIASNTTEIIIHPDWEAYKGKNDKNEFRLPLYPEFKKTDDGLYHSAYQIKDYEPEFYYYGLCSYFAGLRSIIITGLTNVWNQNRLERQFSAPGLLIIPGVNDDNDAQALDEEFQRHMGALSESASSIIIQYLQDLGPGQTAQTAQYIDFLKKEEGNWLSLHQQAEASLITIHNWFRTLTPYSNDKNGFDTNRIINEYEVAMASIIRPHQSMFLEHINKLLADFNFPDSDLEFINEPPVTQINPFKFVWEVRRDSGLEYDPNDFVQRQLVIQVKNTFSSGDEIAKATADKSNK